MVAGDPLNPDVGAAAARLRAGGLVAFPTETVYGLGADAFNPAAVARVYALKGRPPANPLIVHVTGRDMAARAAAEWPAWADRLARALWPGPLTIVLARRPDLPAAVTAGGATVALRAPDHPLALALLFEFGSPLVGPSANPSGRISPTAADHVRDAFSEDDVLVLDGGPCVTGIESTVVQMTSRGLEVLRPGVIGTALLARALGVGAADIRVAPSRQGSDGRESLVSPGMLEQHYAPTAPAVLFDRGQWPQVMARAGDGDVVVLSVGSFNSSDASAVMAMPADARAYAAALYSALRDADRLGPALIAIERPPCPSPGESGDLPEEHETADIWRAVADRLRRAAPPIG